MSDQTESGPVLRGVPVIIHTEPMVFWDLNHAERQARFLEGIDPDFFAYLGRVHESQLEGEDGAHAAVALRVAYSHALESLFSLIGAAVQAPFCPAGWMLKYRNKDLDDLLSTITRRETFHNALGLGRGGWDELARVLLPWPIPDDQLADLRLATARLWKALAKEYCGEDFSDEYNSLKHGMRVQSGGWYFAIGREDVPGIPAPADRMRVMASSNYGSTFLRPVLLSPKRYNFAFDNLSVSWSPAVFAKRLLVVARSMHNVLVFLKVNNGVSSVGLSVATLTEAEVDDALTDPDHSSGNKFSWKHGIDPRWIPEASREDIVASYLGDTANSDKETPE